MNEIEELRNRVNALETLVNSIVMDIASQRADPLNAVQEMRERIVGQLENATRGEYLPPRLHHTGTAKAIAQQFDEIEKTVASMIA